nr:MFS transporter [Sporolactobacillus mangiferae]
MLGEGLFNILFWMFFPFMAIYFSDHFGQEMAGMLLIISQIFGTVFGLFGGYCADHFGRKRMMVFSAIGQAVCFAFFALANSPWLVSPWLTFISFSLLGLFGQLYWPASSAMIADVVPEAHRASVFAIFYTSINVTVVIGPLLGAFFFFNERFFFLIVCTVVSLCLIWALQHWIHETVPHAEPSEDQDVKRSWLKNAWSQLNDYRVIFTDRVFLLYLLAGVLVAQTFMQLDLLIAVYTTDQVPTQTLFSIGEWQATIDGKGLFSAMVSTNGLCVALLTVIVTKWMARFREESVFIGSALCYGVAMFLLGSTVNVWLLLLGIVLFSWAELMAVGAQDSFVAKLAPERLRAQYFAAAGLRFSLGRSIAPIAVSMTVWFGYSLSFIILGSVALVGMGTYGLMFLLRDRRRPLASGQNMQ